MTYSEEKACAMSEGGSLGAWGAYVCTRLHPPLLKHELLISWDDVMFIFFLLTYGSDWQNVNSRIMLINNE